MEINQVQSIIDKSESNVVEFKKSTSQLRAAFETVCSFLNDQGGTVLFGVNDNGKIIGQDISDNTKKELAHEMSKLEPPAQNYIKIDYIPIEKFKYVIAINVSPGGHAPYVFQGRPFERYESITRIMPQHRYEQLLVDRGQLNHSWEEFLAKESDINSLDHEEIRRIVKKAVTKRRIPVGALDDNIEDVLLSLKLLRSGKLINAALVLFAKDTLLPYPQCSIKMARFIGKDKLGDFIDNQKVYGNAFKILTETDAFLRRHLAIASFFRTDQFERIDKPALPVLAVREALINAICHRDYSDPSASISLAIFDDRLEIWSCGSLPKKLKIEDLKRRHESFPRNKLISKVFHASGYIETWGTGTNRMIVLCKKDGIPEPEFEEYSGGLAVIFRFKESISMSFNEKSDSQYQELSLRQKQIVKILMQEKKIALREIIMLLENPPSPRTVGDDLAQLKQLGFVDSDGTGRGAKWFLLGQKKDNGAVMGR